jgi:hypothetical protein
VADTLKVDVSPALTVWFCGWVVMEGKPVTALTVSVAATLVTAPMVFDTVTENVDPLSVSATAAVV